MDFLQNTFLNLGINEQVSNILAFFIFEIIYISIILITSITIFTFIRVKYLGDDFAERLNKKPKIVIYLGMALLGIVSPFCSCSTIPVFTSFSTLGIPTGALFVFLITSPMVQETSLILLLTHFGVPIALIYVILGVTTGVLAGLLISRAKDSDLFTENIASKRSQDNSIDSSNNNTTSCCSSSEINTTSCCGSSESNTTSCCGESPQQSNESTTPLRQAFNNSIETYKSMFKFIAIGIGIGAFIHGVVPDSTIQKLLGTSNIFAPIFATLIGIPTYADDVALIPIAKTLVNGGAGLGTALSFVMSSAVVSVPSFVMLGSVLKKKTLIKLALCLTICITIIGYLLNFIVI